MKTLTVLFVLLAFLPLVTVCSSQEAVAPPPEEAFSSLTSADKLYARQVGDLDRSYFKKLKTLNSEYQKEREALKSKQIELLESGKSAQMNGGKLDEAVAIRDRIAELDSAALTPPVTFVAHDAALASTNKSMLNETGFAKIWKWDKADRRLVFKKGESWIEGDRFHWTETKRTPQCIHLHDKNRNNIGRLYGDAFFYRHASKTTWKMVKGRWLPDAG